MSEKPQNDCQEILLLSVQEILDTDGVFHDDVAGGKLYMEKNSDGAYDVYFASSEFPHPVCKEHCLFIETFNDLSKAVEYYLEVEEKKAA